MRLTDVKNLINMIYGVAFLMSMGKQLQIYSTLCQIRVLQMSNISTPLVHNGNSVQL